jgi:hypothetical protein
VNGGKLCEVAKCKFIAAVDIVAVDLAWWNDFRACCPSDSIHVGGKSGRGQGDGALARCTVMIDQSGDFHQLKCTHETYMIFCVV